MLGGNVIVTRPIGPFHIMSQGVSMGEGGSSPGGNLTGLVNEDGKSSGEFEVGPMEFCQVKA